MLKFHRLLPMLMVLFFTSATAAQTSIVSAQQPQSQYPNLEVIILIDESASMYNFPNRPPGTDPDFWRSEAMELLLNTLAANMTPAQVRLAVMSFSSSHQTEILLDSFIDPTNQVERQRLLMEYYRQRQRPQTVLDGWTDVLDALQKTYQFLQREHDPAYKPVIILLSDGHPETIDAAPADSDNRNPGAEDRWPEYIAQIRDFVPRFNQFSYTGSVCRNEEDGAVIYPITIRKGAEAIARYTDEDKQLWLDMAAATGGNYDDILETSDAAFRQRLATVFLEPLREQACVQVADRGGQPPITVSGSAEMPFEVNDFQEQIIFNFIKSSDSLSVALIDPSGVPISPGQNARRLESTTRRSETWAISRPETGLWAGEWQLQFSGEGSVILSYVSFSASRLSILAPAEGIIAFGPNWEINARLTDSLGNPLSEASITDKSIVVIQPDGTHIRILDNDIDIDDGEILARISDDNIYDAPGIYRIVINIATTIGDISVPFEQVRQFTLSENVPWLAIDRQQYRPGELTQLVGTLKRGVEDADATDGDYNIRANLWRLHGNMTEPIGQYLMSHEPGTLGKFVSDDLGVDLPPGDYRLDVQMSYTPFMGQTFSPPATTNRFTISGEPVASVETPSLPTAIPTASPTATITPTLASMPAATPIPETVSLGEFFTSIPPGLFFGIIGVVLVGVVIIFVVGASDRPSLADIELYDNSNTGYNDRIFDGWDPRNYGNRIIPIRDQHGETLAKILLTPDNNGPEVQVLEIAENHELRVNGQLQYSHDIFQPQNGDRLTIGNVEVGFRGIVTRE